MADQEQTRYPHFILSDTSEAEPFRPHGGGGARPEIPARNRAQHGSALLSQIDALKPSFADARAAQEAAGLGDGFGLQIEFESFPEVDLAFESLAAERSGIELFNMRRNENRTLATVFVPDGKLHLLEHKIAAYLEERQDKNGTPRDHRRLLDAIRAIRAATLRELWTDDEAVFPHDEAEVFWWEVWLPVRKARDEVVASFRALAALQGITVAPGELHFPERTVLLMRASAAQVTQSLKTLNSIAELRRAKDTADFFDSMPVDEQAEWVADLLQRTSFPGSSDAVPHVCVLDTGVNHGHLMLAPALASGDLHTVEPAWGVDDSDPQGHGTGMAGLALLGDLTQRLSSADAVEVLHRLESVKLLPHDGANVGDPLHHGYLTTEAVARPEIAAPTRRRTFALAITARDDRDRGRPSAWSAAVDRLAADADGAGETPRLLVLAAGNIEDPNAWADYPASNATDGIHDPGQAWNALTVGAYTEYVTVTGDASAGYQPIAPEGGLSPFSTTSVAWPRAHWPLKPDVVFEGGNAAKDATGPAALPSLSLLTTFHRPGERLLTTFNATSAATALGARMAAELMAAYPTLWPETIRGLIVHSATWTEAMRAMFLPASGALKKSDCLHMIRHCGFGVPDLERARWTVANSITMLVQDRLHPFARQDSKTPTLRDMHLHRLPWPGGVLESLGETEVQMRVTLSYFIEPNPSVRGVRSRYRYESHGLRFDVKRAGESEQDFRARLNQLARDIEEGTQSGSLDADWLVGSQQRHRGSVHSDIWRGTAADLASRGALAVFPTSGWWKTRPALQRYDTPARYSLLVSIHAPEVEVDLYTPIANLISIPVDVQT